MSTIITRNSANSGSTPASLVQGELAINVTDGRLFYGSGSGNIVKEFTGSASGGTIDTGSFAITGSNTFTGDQIINGENLGLIVDASGLKRVGFMKYGGLEGSIARVANQNFRILRTTGSNINDGTDAITDFYIAGDGKVGIGTTSPAYTLDVSGSSNFTDGQTIVGNITFPSGSFISSTNISGNIYISTLNDGILHLNDDGGEGDVWMLNGQNKLRIEGDTIITGSIHQSGTFFPDQIDWFSSSIGYDTGSYILTTTANGLTTYANYQDVSTIINSGLLTTSSFNAYTGSNTSQFAGTASYATNALSASYAISASYEINYETSSSYADFAVSASHALTASYVNPLHQDVIITGSIYIPNGTNSIYLSGSGAAGRLVWNDTDGTLDLGLKGGNVTLQIGQEEVVRVVNKTGVNLTEAGYQVVRLDGAQGNRIKVALAKGDGDANSLDTLGLVTEDIAINQEGFVTSYGLVRNIDTRGVLQGETWVDGDSLYLSPTVFGGITNIPPTAPSHSVRLGYVVQSSPNGSIFVKVDNGYELDELHNVYINTASLAYGDLLMRDGNDVWINSKQLSGSYGLTGSLTISGSSTFTNIGPAIFSGSVTSTDGFTGSLLGTAATASYVQTAQTASYVLQAVSASFATTASYYGGSVTSASYALTASYSNTSTSASYSNNSTSASYALTATSASHALNANNAITASYVQNAVSASYATQALSSSFATTASYYGGSVTSASYALTSSYSNTSTSASYALNATTATTASYVLQAVSASYAATSSYATQFKVATGLTASGLIYPSADNGNESYIQTDGAGNLSLQYVKSMYETVRNRETSSIIAGIPLFVSGATGANSDVYIADASNPARMPATYIASETIAPSGTGKALISGLLTNINTTTYQAGQEIFVNTGSGITTSRPPYPNRVQLLGIITRVGVNGQAVILNPGQIEIQNIQPGYVLVGNNIGTPTAVATASLSVASASFATTASYIQNAVSASYATQALSSSFATTASYVLQAVSASYATQALSSSYALTATSASYALNATTAQTASYVLNAVSASFATTSSYSNTSTSASYANNTTTAQTASYVLNAVSASYATQALSSSYALTSSYSDTSISASYVLSASYAPSTPAFPYTGSAIISGSLESTGSFKIQGAGNGFTGPFTAIEVDDVNFSRKLFDFDTGSGSLDFGARQLLDRYGTTAIEWTGTSGTYLSNLYGAHRISSGVRDKLYTNNDYSGQILLDVYFDVNVQDNDLVYLGNTGEWLQVEQNNSTATRMLGIAKEIFNQTGSVLIEGDIVVTTTGGYPIVSNAGYGMPVYIKEGTGTQMDTTVPVNDYVRLLGYCYASYNAGNEWIMKFRPSNEWVQL